MKQHSLNFTSNLSVDSFNGYNTVSVIKYLSIANTKIEATQKANSLSG